MADRIADDAINPREASEQVRAIELQHFFQRNLAWRGGLLDRRIAEFAALAQSEKARGQAHLPHGHGYQVSRAPSHLRSEEHTSELQSRLHLVCRLLLEKKNPLPSESAWSSLSMRERLSCWSWRWLEDLGRCAGPHPSRPVQAGCCLRAAFSGGRLTLHT